MLTLRNPKAERTGKHPRALSLAVLLILLTLTCVLSLVVGATSLIGGDVAALLEARGDRTVLGVIVGAAIAMSGTALQGITRNPLADPGILGINAGAALCVVLGLSVFSITSFGAYFGFALVGAVVATLVVTLMAQAAARGMGTGTATPVSFALAGMVFTAAATSVATAVLVADGKSLDVYRYWQVGSVAGRSLADSAWSFGIFAVGFLILLLTSAKLDVLAMGDDVAAGLGERPDRLRFLVGAGAVLLAAASVSVAGPIGFVGLLAPHILRTFVGTSYRVLIPASGLLGGVLVVLADTLGRVVSPPSEVQVGIMTAVVGCPVLLWVLYRMRSL